MELIVIYMLILHSGNHWIPADTLAWVSWENQLLTQVMLFFNTLCIRSHTKKSYWCSRNWEDAAHLPMFMHLFQCSPLSECSYNQYVYAFRGGRYSEEEAKVVIVQILDVVTFFHLQGIVHRDLKPEVPYIDHGCSCKILLILYASSKFSITVCV